MVLRWTQEQADAHQARVHGANKNNHPSRTTNVESSVGNAAEVPNESEGYLPPVAIRFTSYRRKLTDSDAACCKWFIDGLVKAGVLRDDTPAEVTEVSYRQVKIDMWQQEKTEIDLTEAGVSP